MTSLATQGYGVSQRTIQALTYTMQSFTAGWLNTQQQQQQTVSTQASCQPLGLFSSLKVYPSSNKVSASVLNFELFWPHHGSGWYLFSGWTMRTLGVTFHQGVSFTYLTALLYSFVQHCLEAEYTDSKLDWKNNSVNFSVQFWQELAKRSQLLASSLPKAPANGFCGAVCGASMLTFLRSFVVLITSLQWAFH